MAGSTNFDRPGDLDSAISRMRVDLGIRIRLRDGARLGAIAFAPGDAGPTPAIFTLTPYTAQTNFDRGVYFASRGYAYLSVDVRGRGNSEGEYRPFQTDVEDCADIIEWLSKQDFCDGRVAMWGGSYSGFAQWAAARSGHPALVTIAPAASPCLGVDMPGRANVPMPYLVQWLTLVWGRASQDKFFWNNQRYWTLRLHRWFASGAAFNTVDAAVGQPSPLFQEWLRHHEPCPYWEQFNPTRDEYARITIPTLTITGIYDGDQPGAIEHYRRHLSCAGGGADKHFLVIGPWDHAGTRTPQLEYCGLTMGPNSLIDLNQLHLDWYDWVLRGGERPTFLRDRVSYYVLNADLWRHAPSLASVTDRRDRLFLRSDGTADDLDSAGLLCSDAPAGPSDQYLHDPTDMTLPDIELVVDPYDKREQRLVRAAAGRHFVFQSAPYSEETEIAGFFELRAWIAIDQPDADFCATLYEVGPDERTVELARDFIRARYRDDPNRPELVKTSAPLEYRFRSFPFVAVLMRKGSYLRAIIGPVHSIHAQRNFHSGGVVAEETVNDARPVLVRLFHDTDHPSALFVPVGARHPSSRPVTEPSGASQ